MGDSYTIQISSNLVDRLVSKNEKTRKKTKKSKPKDVDSSQLPHSKNSQQQTERFDEHKGPVSSGGWPLQPPLFLPVNAPPPSLTYANELQEIRSTLKESETVLEKLKNREAEMARELTQKAKDLHEKEVKQRQQKFTPCLYEQTACLDCYKKHSDQPLVCADVVKNFSDCAQKAWRDVGASVKKLIIENFPQTTPFV